MARYTLFLIAVIATTATALASISNGPALPSTSHNVTVIAKNQVWPVEGKLVLEACAVEDCSDTPQN